MSILSTESLARISAKNPWKVVIAWIAVLGLSIYLIMNFLGSALSNEMSFSKELESKTAQEILTEKLGVSDKTNEIIVIKSEDKTIEDAEFRTLVEKIFSKVTALKDNVESGINYYQFPQSSLVSADKHVTSIPLVMTGGQIEAIKNAEAVRKVLAESETEGFEIGIVGDGSVNADANHVAEETFQKAEIFGIPLALIVMIFVFGALLAAFLPLILAAFAIVTALGITALIGQQASFTFYIINMILMMGLAVGIDYALFIVSRFREERYHGVEKLKAITNTGATASHAVFFSGLIVLIALAGLMIVPMSIFFSLSAGAIFVVAVAIISVLTLLPALLFIIGDKVNALKIPWVKKESIGSDQRGGFWDKVSTSVMKNPIASVLLTVGLLIVLAIPAFSIKTGAAGIESFPEDLPSIRTYKVYTESFDVGIASPLYVVTDGNANSKAVAQGIEKLKKEIAKKPDVFGPPEEFKVDKEGRTGFLTFQILKNANTEEATKEVEELRKNTIPDSFDDVNTKVFVGGAAAQNLDYFDLTKDYSPIVIGFVLSLSFILLTIVFRSLVVPIKAIAMNLLSVGATYGLLVLVFQKGIGNEIFGFEQVEAIDAWVPLFLFAVLFGLSMDYHVFLLSRIRERFNHTGNNTESVAFGLRTTGRIITGAALIMVAVFSGFAAGDLVMFQQMGFGLAVAVFLDATIIRSILVPASMKLLGNWNWYLPKWLEWIPQINVEGKS